MEGLKRLVIEHHGAAQAKDLQLREQSREIEHLKFQLAKLRRARFGQSSEVLEDVGQMPLTFQELQAAVAEAQRQAQALPEIEVPPAAPVKPVRRKPLPGHFERIRPRPDHNRGDPADSQRGFGGRRQESPCRARTPR